MEWSGDFLAFENSSEEEVEEVKKEKEKKDSGLRTRFQSYAPWSQSEYSNRNFSLRLHEEILDFCAFVSPKPGEHERRLDLVMRLRAVTSRLWPDSELKSFGSFVTRLYLPTSDMDLVLIGAKGRNGMLPMEMIGEELQREEAATEIELVPKARVPIIKFVDAETNIPVDICFDVTSGLDSAKFINDIMLEMPALRPLTLVLKYFLSCRAMNETYHGGIGSFMLQLMVINHLQLHPARSSKNWKYFNSDMNLGTLLYSFFAQYGHSLNYKKIGISVRNGGSYFKKKQKGWYDSTRPLLLSVENPLDEGHDIGANSYNIVKIRRAFYHALQLLSTPSKAERKNSREKEIIKLKDQAQSALAEGKSPEEIFNENEELFEDDDSAPTLLSRLLSWGEEITEHRPLEKISLTPIISARSSSLSAAAPSIDKLRPLQSIVHNEDETQDDADDTFNNKTKKDTKREPDSKNNSKQTKSKDKKQKTHKRRNERQLRGNKPSGQSKKKKVTKQIQKKKSQKGATSEVKRGQRTSTKKKPSFMGVQSHSIGKSSKGPKKSQKGSKNSTKSKSKGIKRKVVVSHGQNRPQKKGKVRF